MTELMISLISSIGVVTSITFSYLAYKRSGNNDLHKEAQKEGKLLSDIAYIKSSIDRMELKLDNVENNYQSLLVRIIKLEDRVKGE